MSFVFGKPKEPPFKKTKIQKQTTTKTQTGKTNISIRAKDRGPGLPTWHRPSPSRIRLRPDESRDRRETRGRGRPGAQIWPGPGMSNSFYGEWKNDINRFGAKSQNICLSLMKNDRNQAIWGQINQNMVFLMVPGPSLQLPENMCDLLRI